MATFLRTSGISSHIENIIVGAMEELVIVSPYLKISNNLFERLKEKSEEGVRIVFIYGKNELSVSEKRKIESLKTINLYYYENLHAKCYYNELEMIITSMNLYEFSEKNNREMGVLIEKDHDAKLYKEGVQETKSIIAASTKVIENDEFIPANLLELFGIDGIDEFLLSELKKVYRRNFEIIQQGGCVSSDNFASKVAVRIYTDSSKWKIVFLLDNERFNVLLNNHKQKIELKFPPNTLSWIKKESSITIELNYNTHYQFFTSQEKLVKTTISFVGTMEGLIFSNIIRTSSGLIHLSEDIIE